MTRASGECPGGGRPPVLRGSQHRSHRDRVAGRRAAQRPGVGRPRGPASSVPDLTGLAQVTQSRARSAPSDFGDRPRPAHRDGLCPRSRCRTLGRRPGLGGHRPDLAQYTGQPYPLRTDRVLFLGEVDHACGRKRTNNENSSMTTARSVTPSTTAAPFAVGQPSSHSEIRHRPQANSTMFQIPRATSGASTSTAA